MRHHRDQARYSLTVVTELPEAWSATCPPPITNTLSTLPPASSAANWLIAVSRLETTLTPCFCAADIHAWAKTCIRTTRVEVLVRRGERQLAHLVSVTAIPRSCAILVRSCRSAKNNVDSACQWPKFGGDALPSFPPHHNCILLAGVCCPASELLEVCHIARKSPRHSACITARWLN